MRGLASRHRRLGLLLGAASLTSVAGCGSADALALMDDPQPAASTATSAVVRLVIDGNTVVATAPGGEEHTVRVLGIRAPQGARSGRPAECGGPEATRFTEHLLAARHVTLVPDPGQPDSDFYHRELRYVRLDDGRDFSVESARAGMSRRYVFGGKPVQERQTIAEAQRQAQNEHRGIWGMCN